MQQMKAARVVAEDAYKQHMEALRQIEESMIVALSLVPSHDL